MGAKIYIRVERFNHYALIIGLLLILIYNSPYLILGKDAIYNIGDNLDGVVAMLKTLSMSSNYFSIDNSQYIESYIGGSMPRNSYPGTFNVVSIIFSSFGI